jgi:DNA-binding CsgD family transcriptional regulator
MITAIKSLLKNEHRYFFGFSIAVGILSILDLSVDLSRGVSLFHIFFEGTVGILSVIIITKLIFKESAQINIMQEKLNILEKESFTLREYNIKYKQATLKYVNEISVIVEQQMDEWGLSKSEKDIALLLLKGLSHKEIADIRQTAEKTVRHQSGIIYSKSQLEGRAQLSAFFLEDIFNSSKTDSKISE